MIRFGSGAGNKLTLEGENIFDPYDNVDKSLLDGYNLQAVINICGGLTVDGKGSLTIDISREGAAIGTDQNEDSSANITINGGNITIGITGGGSGANIGSGSSGSVGDIIINGGNITSSSGNIGSGSGGKAGNILITGGDISSEGIGPKVSGSVGEIHITGNAKITAENGEPGSAAIDGSFAYHRAHNSTGNITIDGNATVTTITNSRYIVSGTYSMGDEDATIRVGEDNENIRIYDEYHPHGIGIGAGCEDDSLSTSTAGDVIISGNSVVILDNYFDDVSVKINGQMYSGHYHLFKDGKHVETTDSSTDLDDFLINEISRQSVEGLGGNDLINNYKASFATLLGGEGNDTIRGEISSTISGGKGDDLLRGMDTYKYDVGDGNDTIVNYVQYDLYYKKYIPLWINGDYTVAREKKMFVSMSVLAPFSSKIFQVTLST